MCIFFSINNECKWGHTYHFKMGVFSGGLDGLTATDILQMDIFRLNIISFINKNDELSKWSKTVYLSLFLRQLIFLVYCPSSRHNFWAPPTDHKISEYCIFSIPRNLYNTYIYKKYSKPIYNKRIFNKCKSNIWYHINAPGIVNRCFQTFGPWCTTRELVHCVIPKSSDVRKRFKILCISKYL